MMGNNQTTVVHVKLKGLLVLKYIEIEFIGFILLVVKMKIKC